MEGTRIRAEDVGAPHRRERLFVIAYAERDALRVRPERVPARREARELQAAREGVAVHDGEPRGLARCGARAWSVEPSVGRMAHGIPHRVDRLRALGNAVVPQVAEVVGRRVMQLATEAAA
jgi:DNA (cytosine-5)-methyltransferase 1